MAAFALRDTQRLIDRGQLGGAALSGTRISANNRSL
jgi:hypothetical protein